MMIKVLCMKWSVINKYINKEIWPLVRDAPEPRIIVWKKLKANTRSQQIRRLCSFLGFILTLSIGVGLVAFVIKAFVPEASQDFDCSKL